MLVRNTLLAAQNLRNPFTIAYRGFEIGDPAVDKRIAAWTSGPIASRLTPVLAASLHYEILRLTVEAFEKRTKGE
jgi:hypothetical protein